MEYIIRSCPKCNGELRIPQNMKTCICMYCGVTIDLEQQETPKAGTVDAQQENLQMRKEAYQGSLESIPQLFKQYDQSMINFNRSNYCTRFEDYIKTGSQVLMPAENLYKRSAQEGDALIGELTKTIIDTADRMLLDKPKARQKEALMQLRFFLTCYMVPMIRGLKLSLSEPLAECIVQTWNSQNPKNTFQKADFDQILQGFQRKGMCFITTAVCETMNKPDDCYELTVFRRFRDEYMLKSMEGIQLVEEYYRVAPSIVMLINMESDRKERYTEIWHKYLRVCLKDIENKSYQSCEKRYTRMVQTLKKNYFIGD